jgi:cbb3-type cytochrome c oxidase subunit III
MLSTLLLLSSLAQAPDSGAVLYQSWCKSCHGARGTGISSATARLEVPAADLADCKGGTAEPEDRWIGIVTSGGASVGLSLDMPAFGEAATPEQIRMVVRYIKSLCREPGWPPGELNFPRAFLVEKAFPEDEWVLTDEARGQALIYERRLGKRFQMEAEARTAFDGAPNQFDGATASLKYNAWHSLARRALASFGIEATPPLGRADAWEVEPFVSFGANPARALFVQGEVTAAFAEAEGFADFNYRLGVGRQVGRVVPMVEAGWFVPTSGERVLSIYPQMWVQLSRLGHVAASIGAELPATGPEPRRPRLIAFLLWDFGDAPLTRGW